MLRFRISPYSCRPPILEFHGHEPNSPASSCSHGGIHRRLLRLRSFALFHSGRTESAAGRRRGGPFSHRQYSHQLFRRFQVPAVLRPRKAFQTMKFSLLKSRTWLRCRRYPIYLGCLLLLLWGGKTPAQNVINETEFLNSDRPEAWAMNNSRPSHCSPDSAYRIAASSAPSKGVPNWIGFPN